MADMQITNLTTNPYTFGPYQLPPLGTVTIDTTTNASLYLTDDAFADIVNALYVAPTPLISVTNPPTPFPRVTGVPQILHGDGSPEGVVFAPSGSTFMRRDNSGANNSLYAKATGPSLNTGWHAFSGIQPIAVTTLPASPSDGQQVVFVDSTSAPTYAWLLQYVASAAAWLFLGGSSLEGTTSVTIPRAGSYYCEIGAQGGSFSGTTNVQLALTAGGITLHANQGATGGGTEGIVGSAFDRGRMTGLTAAQVLTPTVTGTPTRQFIRVQPVAVT